eukprot:TRINITY_DN4212_c0_g1_i14.p1 TRINITY_DN4212_c0_g1~~TRINITY_DN4212_c0_g1_i14.p1  ORF type:complete len:562 (+),score=104.38 TRINITY_DN4212_c0_g1_i14:37-1722(+)
MVPGETRRIMVHKIMEMLAMAPKEAGISESEQAHKIQQSAASFEAKVLHESSSETEYTKKLASKMIKFKRKFAPGAQPGPAPPSLVGLPPDSAAAAAEQQHRQLQAHAQHQQRTHHAIKQLQKPQHQQEQEQELQQTELSTDDYWKQYGTLKDFFLPKLETFIQKIKAQPPASDPKKTQQRNELLREMNIYQQELTHKTRQDRGESAITHTETLMIKKISAMYAKMQAKKPAMVCKPAQDELSELVRPIRDPVFSILSGLCTLQSNKRARLAQQVGVVRDQQNRLNTNRHALEVEGPEPQATLRDTVVGGASGDAYMLLSRASKNSKGKLSRVNDSGMNAIAGECLSAAIIQQQLLSLDSESFLSPSQQLHPSGTMDITLTEASTSSLIRFSWRAGASPLQFGFRLPEVWLQADRHGLGCAVLWRPFDSLEDLLNRVQKVLNQFALVDTARSLLTPGLHSISVHIECSPQPVQHTIIFRCAVQLGVWVPQLLLSLSLDGTQLSKHRLDGLCLPSTTNSVEGWFGTKMNQVSVHNVHSLLESWLHALDSQLAPNTESGMSFA